MNQGIAKGKKRSVYMDYLRIIAVFFVIVNHTNSQVYQGTSPDHLTWYLSMLWYYLSKTAVPIFVMVSGACLLPKVDSYRKIGKRVWRMVAALVLFSYIYFLNDAQIYYGIWPRAVNVSAFFSLIWTQQITDSYWYLYFYIGILVMLPLMQRLAQNMKKQDMLYLIGLSFGLYAIWPLITHYAPAMAMPSFFDVPMFSIYIGIFFAGHYVHQYLKVNKKHAMIALVILIATLLASLGLTHIEFGRVGAGEKYWFMDDRMHPSILTILSALSIMVLAKTATPDNTPERAQRRIVEIGSCTFCMYLLQDLIIDRTKGNILPMLSSKMSIFPAVIIWEIVIFIAALAASWILRRIPFLKKII
ncbi:MAG: acyltransferase [Clostridiales bacterium]|nr:acyltransferase [Clostridiales bacterium]